MAKTNPDTILIKGDYFVVHEADASVVMTPGEFVRFDSNGDFAVCVATDIDKMILIEDDIQGNEITDDYASGVKARAAYCAPGSIVRAILADGQSVVIGAELQMAAGGELTALASNTAVARAMEAVDASDSATTAQNSRRINVMLL